MTDSAVKKRSRGRPRVHARGNLDAVHAYKARERDAGKRCVHVWLPAELRDAATETAALDGLSLGELLTELLREEISR